MTAAELEAMVFGGQLVRQVRSAAGAPQSR